jgi:hypothetical protein
VVFIATQRDRKYPSFPLRHAYLTDLGTGRTRPIGPTYGGGTTIGNTSLERETVAISGDVLVYPKLNGSVWIQHLDGGKPIKVHTGGQQVVNHTEVFAHGDWVGWSVAGDPESVAFRNIATMAPAVVTPTDSFGFLSPIASLSDTGAVIDHAGVDTTLHTWRLQPYDGSAMINLVPHQVATAPQITGNVLTWLTPPQQLEESVLPWPSVAPRYLGDADAPSTFKRSEGWRAHIPFSEALTTCTVSFRQGATVVAEIPCDQSSMREGDVLAKWNGLTTSGQHVHGDVTWQVNAANATGPAALADGSAGSVSGTVTVT